MNPRIINKTEKWILIYVPITPTSLNKLIGSRGRSFKKSTEVKQWASILQSIRLKDSIKTFQNPMVSFLFNFKNNRKHDPDNYVKIPLDALVKSGWITDDSSKHMKFGCVDVNNKADEISTLIMIEEQKCSE